MSISEADSDIQGICVWIRGNLHFEVDSYVSLCPYFKLLPVFVYTHKNVNNCVVQPTY